MCLILKARLSCKISAINFIPDIPDQGNQKCLYDSCFINFCLNLLLWNIHVFVLKKTNINDKPMDKKGCFVYISLKLIEAQKVFSYTWFCCLTVIMFYAPSKQIKLRIVFHSPETKTNSETVTWPPLLGYNSNISPILKFCSCSKVHDPITKDRANSDKNR